MDRDSLVDFFYFLNNNINRFDQGYYDLLKIILILFLYFRSIIYNNDLFIDVVFILLFNFLCDFYFGMGGGFRFEKLL